MKQSTLLVSAIFVFLFFNYGIFRSEQILASNDIVYLPLSPVDPRSLMQGDYMRLNFGVRERLGLYGGQTPRYVIFRIDASRVGTFARLDDGTLLQPDERRFKINNHDIFPNSYMFQEGKAEHYARASYAIFKFSPEGLYRLFGLADEKFEAL